MKIIAIGDTHGSDHWKTVSRSRSFDKFVFIGDYFDSVDYPMQHQIENFQEIIAFKQANPEKVVLLIGNHDFHYTSTAIRHGERYSGYDVRNSSSINQLLETYQPLLQPAYRHSPFLFSHAGVSNTWLQDFGYKGEVVDEFINTLFATDPTAFLFRGSDPYGDDVTQSPIWIRPASLMLDGYPAKQVVGHTKFRQIKIVEDSFFFIDTLVGLKQCLCVEDGTVSIIARA